MLKTLMDIQKAKKISVVSPAYKCAGCIEPLCDRLIKTLKKIAEDFEIILVNDASPDNSWAIIKKVAKQDNRIKGINLSRNFGQHYAITAGIDYSSGDWVVVMDCDLQDAPEEIKKLYSKAINGHYDIVFGRRAKRRDGLIKMLSSKYFYKVFNYLSGIKFDHRVANFSISKRSVINSFKELREQNRSFPYFINWLGYNKGYIDVNHGKRDKGKSSYSYKKLLKFAFDNIVAYSNMPLVISILVGLLISIAAIIYALFLIIRYIGHGITVEGWTSVMVSVWFLGGLILANLGVVGLYVGKIFNEAKKRPLYVVKERVGFN